MFNLWIDDEDAQLIEQVSLVIVICHIHLNGAGIKKIILSCHELASIIFCQKDLLFGN